MRARVSVRERASAAERVSARLGVVATAVLGAGLVFGTVLASPPAYSAPDDCPPPGSCSQEQPSGASTTEPTPGAATDPEKPEPDKEAPTTPLVGQPVVGPGGEVELSVTAEADAALALEESGSVVAQETATGQPQVLTWTAANGSHTYSLTATDEAGNDSVPASVTVDVDATPPALRHFAVASGNGKDTHSHVTVRTEPDTAFRMLVDDKVVAAGTTGDGVIEETLDLADGRHVVQVRLTDDVGNERTQTRTLVVRIPQLRLTARLLSGVTDEVQVVRVRSSAAVTGVVEVPGGTVEKFRLEGGSARVRLRLPDDSYSSVTVTVHDAHGRSGKASLADFTVDTTAPVLTVAADRESAARGRFSAKVRADDSTSVTWQLLDAAGHVVASGEYVAIGREQTIERDVEEGTYALEVTATDTYGRATSTRESVRIAADPLSTATVVSAALGVLVLVAAVTAGLLVLWRRRRGPVGPGGHEDRDTSREIVVDGTPATPPVAAEELWRERHDLLTRLIDIAQGATPDDIVVPAAVELQPEESVLFSTTARLTEPGGAPGRAGRAIAVDAGQLLLTDQRIAFVGERERRDWWHALVERVCHVDHCHTTIELWDRATRAGLEYDDPEVTRLYIDLVVSGQDGTRAAYLGQLRQGLRDHEMRRPATAA